jgi:DNA-binding NtrC family response regulator
VERVLVADDESGIRTFDGLTLVRKVRRERPLMEVLVLSAHGTVASAIDAMKLGAFDFLTKPLSDPNELRRAVARALSVRRGRETNPDRQARHLCVRFDRVRGDHKAPRCLQEDPADRFQAANELVVALSEMTPGIISPGGSLHA